MATKGKNKKKNQKSLADRFFELPSVVAKSVTALAVVGLIGGGYYAYTNGMLGCAPRDLGEMDQHLGRCGTVVVVGEDLPSLDVTEGCDLIPASKHPAVERALKGRSEQELVDALRGAGANKILVEVDTTDPQLLPEPTLRHLLGTYRTFDHFHAVYLSQAAGLFEIGDSFVMSDAAGNDLVRIARAVLTGNEAPGHESLMGEVTRRHPDKVSVAVALQGLQPIERTKSKSVNFNRRDFFIVRTGSNLRDATVAASKRIIQRWEPTGGLEREGELGEALDRLTIEIEVIYDKTPIALLRSKIMGPMAYKKHLWNVIELGVHGLSGNFKNSDRSRYILPSSAPYRARPDVDSVIKRLARNFDLDGDDDTDDDDEGAYPMAEELRVERFRTHHFREMEPEGEVKRLRRGFVPVDQDAVTRDGVREAVSQAAGWLVENLRDDGLFEYKYFPARDVYYREFHPDVEEAHNIVRHGLACYSMFMVAHEFEENEEFWETAMSSMEVMLENTVVGPGWYSDGGRRGQLPENRRQRCETTSSCESPSSCIEGYCRLPFGPPVGGDGPDQRVASGDSWESHDGYRRSLDQLMMYVRWKDVGKMGTVAALVLAMTEMIAARPELLDEYRPYLEGYWRFFRFMQKADGSFNHYFTVRGDVRYYSRETTIYPGEILFAISRIYRLLGDREMKESFDRGMRFYGEWYRAQVQEINSDGTYNEMRRNDLMAFAPWVTMAANDMYEQHQESYYAEIGVETSDWISQRFQFTPDRAYYPAYWGSYYRLWWEQPAMHGIVYTEGTAAGFNLARAANDEERAERLRVSTLLGCRFAIQQVIRPGIDDIYLPGRRARVRARGGVRFSLTVDDLRTDYTYHSLSALVQALRYYRDEDDWEI